MPSIGYVLRMRNITQWAETIKTARYPYPKARTLKKIAEWVNSNPSLGLAANTRSVVYSTDRKAGRLRIPGKGRKGVLLTLTDESGKILFSHNSGETYRCNFEVERWLAFYILAHPHMQELSMP